MCVASSALSLSKDVTRYAPLLSPKPAMHVTHFFSLRGSFHLDICVVIYKSYLVLLLLSFQPIECFLNAILQLKNGTPVLTLRNPLVSLLCHEFPMGGGNSTKDI